MDKADIEARLNCNFIFIFISLLNYLTKTIIYNVYYDKNNKK